MEYESKFDKPDSIHFRVEEAHKKLFLEWCDSQGDYGYSPSAILRQMLIQFLRDKELIE